MKKQYRFYRKIIQFWLLPKEPFTHVSLQVYSQKLSLIWCILQILHGFWADVDSTAKIQPPTEYWTKKKKEIWDITVLQTNRPTIAYNQRALKESHSTLTIPSRYFSVGHTELSCFGPPCSPTNLWPGFLGQPQARLWGWSTGLLLWTSSTTSRASVIKRSSFLSCWKHQPPCVFSCWQWDLQFTCVGMQPTEGCEKGKKKFSATLQKFHRERQRL